MQKHHAAREVFLTQMVDNNDVESLWRPAQVCLPDTFDRTTGDDVFICEYEYDTVWQVCCSLILSRHGHTVFADGPATALHTLCHAAALLAKSMPLFQYVVCCVCCMAGCFSCTLTVAQTVNMRS